MNEMQRQCAPDSPLDDNGRKSLPNASDICCNAPPGRGGSQPVEPEYYSVAQVAHLLNISEKLVRAMIRRGEIMANPFGRLIRIHMSEIAKLKNRYIKPKIA